MSNEYFALLQRPEWQKKRLERLEIAKWECENCGEKANQLHVHHKQYFKNRNPWEYKNEQLEVLCDPCHEKAHLMIESIKQILSFSNNNEIFNLLIGFSDPEIISKIDEPPYDEYDLATQFVGCIAKLTMFVKQSEYKFLSESLINHSLRKSDAEDFFRKKYDIEWEVL